MKSRGRPKTDTKPIMLRMPAGVVAKIDDARREIEDLPSRQELIRRIVEEWIAARDR